MRKELSIENDTFIFLHAGRFEEQKNHEYLVDIFKDYHSDNPNSKLVLVGRGPLEGEVRNKVLDEGLEESVYFLGVRADMSSLYSAADIFLFPSLFEGLPVVLVEAQASSLACMVSERIDKSIDVTKLVKFIPIDSNTEIWVDSINRSRVEDLDRIQRDSMQAFNISETVKLLTSFYEVSND